MLKKKKIFSYLKSPNFLLTEAPIVDSADAVFSEADFITVEVFWYLCTKEIF